MDQNFEKIFFEIHSGNPREGPGDFESTQRALALMLDLPKRPRILDIGCGPGKQTLDLITMTDGSITAVDNHQPFIDRLNRQAARKGLSDRIKAVQGDMHHLDFNPHSFDVIWSEGAIYIIGFERGLQSWRPFLKHNGYVAVTEASWLKPNPPEELKKFWEEAYPALQNIKGNSEIIQTSGYALLGHFTLPERAWWDDYYKPIAKKLPMLKAKYRNNADALQVIAAEETEMALFRKYSDYYGYVFYVMRLL